MTAATSSDDSDLVRLALQGQKEAFGGLYDRHFPAVYDFLHRLMRNADEAADLTQETFLRALERLDRLADPAKFKPWVLSIAHNQALNRIGRMKRIATPPPSDSGEEEDEMLDPLARQIDPDRLTNPEQAVELQETAALVWEAAASLDQRTYAVLDLHVRRGLDSAEIAEVLGVSKGNAYTMLSRMKDSVEEAIGAFVMARQGSKDCDELRRVLAPFAIPPVTPEVRRAVDKHVRRCEVCSRTRRRLVSPLELLGAFAAVPAPLGLREQVWGALDLHWAEASAGWASGGGGEGATAGEETPSEPEGGPEGSTQDGGEPSGNGGAPGEGGMGGGGDGGKGGGIADWFRGWSRRRIALALGGALLATLAVVAVLYSAFSGGSEKAAPTPVPTASRPTPVATKRPTPVRTPVPTPAAVPTLEPTATPVLVTVEPPTSTPVPPTPTAVPTLRPSPAPTRTPRPTSTPHATATPTPPPPTPAPTSTSTPYPLY